VKIDASGQGQGGRPYQPEEAQAPTKAPAGVDENTRGYEVFYRAMSNKDLASFATRGIYPIKGESFVTKEVGYIKDQIPNNKAGEYNVIVTMYTRLGTGQKLFDNGARDRDPSNEVIRRGLGYLPVLRPGNVNEVHVKTENDYLTYGLRGLGMGSSAIRDV
jgi:hypothetical protein